MFFELCNSPATFQAMMNKLFQDIINEKWLIIYIDDMLIHSTKKNEHKKKNLIYTTET
jgi:hypothetical protein